MAAQLKAGKGITFRGDVALALDLVTVGKTPPLAHTIAKNLLDLLGKRDGGRQLFFRSPALLSNSRRTGAHYRRDARRGDVAVLLRANPDAPIDGERNNALNRLLKMCEWAPEHDRAKMLIVARALIDGGVSISGRNVHGDTTYSIAKAERYCGLNHPVTVMIHDMYYAKGKAAGETCLATCELDSPSGRELERRDDWMRARRQTEGDPALRVGSWKRPGLPDRSSSRECALTQ